MTLKFIGLGNWVNHSLVPRPVRAIRVTRGDLEPSTIARRRDKLDRWRHIQNRRGLPGTRQSESGFIQGYYNGKTDLKFDSLSFLTLITKRQSHSAFCIRHSAFCKIPLPHRVCLSPKGKSHCNAHAPLHNTDNGTAWNVVTWILTRALMGK